MKKHLLLLFMVGVTSLLWGQTIPITTVDELTALSTNIAMENGYVGQTIVLNNDLTITKPWRPIGTAAQPFQGTFHGNGHVISGLGAVSGTDGVGLFGYVGTDATIQEVGIGTGHIKTMKNDVCQYIGALVGHNAGTVVRCWNMATIEVNGTNVGGLVGQNEGKIEDCYNAGPILKANDLIGGLVGTNTGTIHRCYNIGFVRNGYGLVEKNTGSITDSYYDSQLYIQNPDPSHKDTDGVTAVEKTKDMFSIFAGKATWVTGSENYPMLAVFANHDAAKVSVASVDLDPVYSPSTKNHMNALDDFFKVNTADGVSWSTTSEEQANWVYPIPGTNQWGIAHPCRPTECILTVSKSSHVREVYAFPMPVPDFYAGKMDAEQQTVCLGETLGFNNKFYTDIDPTGGKPDYRVQLVLTWNENNTSKDSILFEETNLDDYLNNLKNVTWTPNKPGTYTIIRRAADSQCHTEFIPSEGRIPVLVLDTVKPGKIEYTGEDTLCYPGGTIQINNKEEATSEGSTVHYFWLKGTDTLQNETGSSLTYILTQAGTYTFSRYAYNDECVDKEHAVLSKTPVTVVVLGEFDAGAIDVTPNAVIYCKTEGSELDITTIGELTPATGGQAPYDYQWRVSVDGATATVIPNADGSTYKVSEYTDFEAGHTYTFSRYVKDSLCVSEWQHSNNEQVITVANALTAGKIQATNTTLCWGEKLTINSQTDATGDATVQYYWTLDGDEIDSEVNKTLTHYTIPSAGEHEFVRHAYDNQCVDKANAKHSDTVTVTMLELFDAGTLVGGNTEITACTLEEALAQLAAIMGQANIIKGSAAAGGDKNYHYKWDLWTDEVTRTIEDPETQEYIKTQNLDLTSLGLTNDHKYIFTRSAKDGHCQGEYKKSEGQVILNIFNSVSAGKIETTPIDKTCLVRSKTPEVEITIHSSQPANAGERSTVTYNWYMESKGKVRVIYTGKEADLTYTLPTNTLPDDVTYTFYRKAVSDSCQCDEVQAEGTTQVHISFTREDTIHIDLCESQFVNGKYIFSYPNKEEARITHTFVQEDMSPWTFKDPVETGCQPQITIIPNFLPSPKIQTDNIAEVCQDGEDGTLSLYFQMVAGSADMYSIELSDGLKPYFDNQAYITGTMPTVSAGEPGVITLQCKRIGFLGGEKIMYLQVGMESDVPGQSSCFSTASQITLNVTQGGYIYTKYDKVLYIDNNPKKETDPKFIGYQWYKNGLLVEGATGQYYDEGGAILKGSYFADLTYLENGREAVLRTCTLQMPVENPGKSATHAPNADKRLEQGRIIIHRGDNQYDIFGTKLGNK